MESSDVSRIILYLLMMITDLAAVKITYSKSACYCGETDSIISDIISNGNYSDVEQIDKRCNGPAYLRINLGDIFIVHYVVVFEGKADEGKNAGQLDFFKIEVGHETFSRCSEYPNTSPGPNKGMRVNCEFIEENIVVKSVVLHSLINKGFYLAEIEIHNLASDKPVTKLLLYHGCITNYEGILNSSKTTKESSIIHCQKICISKKFSLATIKGDICQCRNQYGISDRVPDDYCNVKCDDGVHSCGGNYFASMYIVILQLPNYVGCFESSGFNSDYKYEGNVTILDCLYHCNDFFYAVLQSGNTCLCWNNTIETKRNDNHIKCTSKCTGELETFCGAEGYASVYGTCNRLKYNLMKCSELFKCADRYNVFGECVGKCKIGYVGLHCLESKYYYATKRTTISTTLPTKITTSSTTKNMTTPSSATASEILSTTKEIETSTYRGLTNFTKESSHIFTSEIDLCLILNPCKDVSNSYCVMYEKKVLCACTIGYSKNANTDVCEDIDECEMKPCDLSSTTCTNLNGSYICDCNEGYIRLTDEICSRDTKNIFQGIEVEEMEPMNSWNNLKFILFFSILCIGAIGIIYVCRRQPEDM